MISARILTNISARLSFNDICPNSHQHLSTIKFQWYLPEFSPTFQHNQVSMISTRILTNISARLSFNHICPNSHQHFSTIKFQWYLCEFSPTFQHKKVSMISAQILTNISAQQVSMISVRILTNISAQLSFHDICPNFHQHFSTSKFHWYLPEFSPTFQHD